LGRGGTKTLLENFQFFEFVVQFVIGLLCDLVLVVEVGIVILLKILEASWRKSGEDIVRIGDHELVELVVFINFVKVLIRDAFDSTEI
jgi:hypothetical protein